MAEFKTLPLDQIKVPEDRLRRVNENKAFLLGQSIATGELIHPITIYRTPNGERPYTLAAGATRYRAHELHGLPKIDVLIRKLDKAGARRIEVEENLFRDDLTKLERALHVVEYRRLWEEEHGWDKGGRPTKETSANLAEVSQEGAQQHFFAQALDDLGLSRRAIERAQFIGSKLQPALRDLLRDTREADNQQMLEKLAGMEPARQKLVAKAYGTTPDIKRAIELTDPNARAKATVSQQQELLSRLVSTWDRADEKTRAAFLEHAKATLKKTRQRLPSLTELLAQTEPAGPDPNQITIFDALGEERGA